MRTAVHPRFRGAHRDLGRDQPYPRDEADRRGARVFARGDLWGTASFAAPGVAVDRGGLDGAVVLRLPDHALVVSGELCGSGNVAGVCGGRARREVPAAGTAERGALGRRDFHLLRGGAGVGGSNAGVAARRGFCSRCSRRHICGRRGADGVLSFQRLGGMALFSSFPASRYRRGERFTFRSEYSQTAQGTRPRRV